MVAQKSIDVVARRRPLTNVTIMFYVDRETRRKNYGELICRDPLQTGTALIVTTTSIEYRFVNNKIELELH